jgi:hypothetical protein
MSHEIVHDVVMERASSIAAYGTSGSIAVTGFTMQEWYGLIGLIFMAMTFVLNAYYRRKTYQHQVFMQKNALREQTEDASCRSEGLK